MLMVPSCIHILLDYQKFSRAKFHELVSCNLSWKQIQHLWWPHVQFLSAMPIHHSSYAMLEYLLPVRDEFCVRPSQFHSLKLINHSSHLPVGEHQRNLKANLANLEAFDLK